MAELEVDQSPLPQVQDVCQCFAVLEDGALAHNLQEQEIEQYYSSNVQKNLLVQNDIRTAKRLQDEEEQRAQQLEEQDSRYAQMIQEEIERRAEEARMREEEDEEIARRLQEEEEMEVRQQRLANGHRDTNSFPLAQECPSAPAPPFPPRSVPSERVWEIRHPPASRGHRPASLNDTDSLQRDSQRPDGNMSESGDSGEISDEEVFSSTCTHDHMQDRWRRGRHHRQEEWLGRVGAVDMHRDRARGWEIRHTSSYCEASPSDKGPGGSRHRSWTYRDSREARERHVHFQDETRYNTVHGDIRGIASSGSSRHWCGDQGDAAQVTYPEDSFPQPRRKSRDLEFTRWKEHNHHDQLLERAVSTRHTYGGELRDSDRGRDSGRWEHSQGSNHGGHRMRYPQNLSIQVRRSYQRAEPSNENGRQEECRTSKAHGSRRYRESGEADGDHRLKQSESTLWQEFREQSSSEEDVGPREKQQRRIRGGFRRTTSFSGSLVSPRDRCRGAGMTQGRAAASLDLGALHQVLLDEELARRLQEEEEKLLVMSPKSSPSVKNRDLEGDFRVAQVAQDEEIAHYMQHQERKSRRWSRDLEGLEPCSEHRELDQAHERMVPETLRGRLDSEGLNSPVEDCSPERQSASPVCTTLQQQAVRNIAEELDPTFRANRRGSNSTRQAPGNCETSLSPQCSVHNYMLEPAFVPPTKRQSDKLERPKAKEKICKQQ